MPTWTSILMMLLMHSDTEIADIEALVANAKSAITKIAADGGNVPQEISDAVAGAEGVLTGVTKLLADVMTGAAPAAPPAPPAA
jgi:hypothetical protein